MPAARSAEYAAARLWQNPVAAVSRTAHSRLSNKCRAHALRLTQMRWPDSPESDSPFWRAQKAQISALYDFDVIVSETNGSKGQRRPHHQPHKRIRKISPQRRRQQNSNADEHPTHRGRACFFLVVLWPFFADVLANLELAQLFDDIWSDNERDQQRRERSKCGAERQIPEDAEWSEVREKLLIQEPVEQIHPPANFRYFRFILQVEFCCNC